MPEPSIFDARLAEIDRRLRTIQSGLEPSPPTPPTPAAPTGSGSGSVSADVAEPPPTPPESPLVPPTPLRAVAPPPPAPTAAEEADRLITRLRGLVAEHERLLVEAREALAGATPSAPAPVSLSAGPFTETAQLRGFAQAVMALPGVREGVVREYAGGDRAVIDVHLG